ncbi:hypothetical protein FIS3754_17090 [Fischerella sp. NIES-3754]|nr:hypothetical protein FIS3754_17090 [Fischerella sp. NIES-3754]BCX08077.1 MAG: hypothetical protein KatS3mg066_1936 [Fischerella sp.]
MDYEFAVRFLPSAPNSYSGAEFHNPDPYFQTGYEVL